MHDFKSFVKLDQPERDNFKTAVICSISLLIIELEEPVEVEPPVKFSAPDPASVLLIVESVRSSVVYVEFCFFFNILKRL